MITGMAIRNTVQRHPATIYFILTFLISWSGAFALVAGKILHGESIPRLDGILMFPLMLLGPFLSGLIMTFLTGGKKSLGVFKERLRPGNFSARWFLPVLIAPLCILGALFILTETFSREYKPNFYVTGFLFGILAGIMEEIGWMGFAFPNMNRQRSALSNGILLGIIWSIWHLPVIDFLGTATPHGTWWFPYFLSFALVMTAIRVIIVWTYCNTQSILLSQIMHISSTGFLVMLSPSPISVQHEPIWYFVYAVILWVVVIYITWRWGRNLGLKINPALH
jgi:membrane protease YdiL (CAAX protease family)